MEEEGLAIFLVTFTGVTNPALVPLARRGAVYAGQHHHTFGSLLLPFALTFILFCVLLLCLL